MTAIIAIVIILCFVFLVYKNKYMSDTMKGNDISIPELFLATVSSGFLLYSVFFYFSDYIRSFNIKFPHEQFIPPARAASYEYDGIEGYVLYAAMFVNIIVSFAFVQLLLHVKNKILYFLIFLALTIAGVMYITKIGFIPPMSNFPDYRNVNPFIAIVILILTGLLILMYDKLKPKIFLVCISVLLLPVCFIATEVISVFDYSFILSPALRLLNGNPLSEIYFQYDLFLSLLAALWMKLDINLNLFQLLGQLSFFALFIGVFIFSKKFFINKKFPLFILLLLLILRYYAIMHEPVAIFQVTPLRLELWLILLVLVYYKGVYHWINAVVIGILLMLHKNFGLLYLLAYYQVVITLFIVGWVEVIVNRKNSGITVGVFFKKQLLLNFKNLFIIAVFVIVSIILFKGFIPKSALLYQQIGVGMIPVSAKSFYWYIPAIFSLCFILLLKYRNKLSAQYFHTGLLIVFLGIANSIYFFGRSHEHNILNISTSLVLVLFLLLDFVGADFTITEEGTQKQKSTKKINTDVAWNERIIKLKKIVVVVFPFLLIAGSSYYYSEKIGYKIKTQYKNFKKAQYIYPLTVPTDFASVKKITNNSDNVYFLNYVDDFLYYYYGNYKPVGYFSPCATWLLKDDLVNFVQGLLDQHYYVVSTNMLHIMELLPSLKYNRVKSEGAYTAISRDSVELLLPKSSDNPLTHIGVSDDLGKNGIHLPPISLNENFTIELLLKPRSEQVANSSVLVNAITDSIGPGGFTFQQNGPAHNQFLFAYGGGKTWTPPAMFMLHVNEWNYIVVAVNKNIIRVYDNGQMVASEKSDFSIKNVDAPLVIANGTGQNNSFNGLIREVKITNDTISEQTILQTLNNIKARLN